MASPVDPTQEQSMQQYTMDRFYSMQSMKSATIGNAKALFGILFIQYCSYSFFYIMDHVFQIYPEYFTELKKKK